MGIRSIFICGLALILFGSCTKGPDNRIAEPQITASVEGNVVFGGIGFWNPTGIRVRCGDREIILDSTGNFFFKDVNLAAKLATVTAEMNGKLIMTKSFVPNANHNYVRIELWPDIFSNRTISTASDYNSGIDFGQIFHVLISS